MLSRWNPTESNFFFFYVTRSHKYHGFCKIHEEVTQEDLCVIRVGRVELLNKLVDVYSKIKVEVSNN